MAEDHSLVVCLSPSVEGLMYIQTSIINKSAYHSKLELLNRVLMSYVLKWKRHRDLVTLNPFKISWTKQ
jgi:hypothetical protein